MKLAVYDTRYRCTVCQRDRRCNDRGPTATLWCSQRCDQDTPHKRLEPAKQEAKP